MFIALRWMQRPERVMVWLTENIQACLRIFWQPQHQWLVRDILHLPQGVFAVYVLHPPQKYTDENPSSGVLPSRQRLGDMLSIPRALPPVTQGSAFQAPECSRRCIVLSVVEKKSRGLVFIYVYRLAMDAKTRKGDGVAD